MGTLDELFTPEAEERIRGAVEKAEGTTSGEIVPYVVAASDSYEGVLWKAAAFGALFFALAAAGIRQFSDLWGPPLALWLTGPPLLGAGLGYLAAGAAEPLRRALIGEEVIERRVRRRAAVAFLEEEIFRTRERTGILIFLSLFEHRVVILGDEGINRRVEKDEWEGIVDDLVSRIRAGETVEGLVAAITRCGELLERRGVAIREDDADELRDHLRSRER
jgi:putative membrane protein